MTYRPTVPQDVKRETHKTFQKRVRLLRRYIDALTVKPADPLEVIHAVAHDLTEIAIKYGGSFPRATGDSCPNEQTAENAQKAAVERS